MNDLDIAINAVAKRWAASTKAHCELLKDAEQIRDSARREAVKSRENRVFQKEILNLYQANILADQIHISAKAQVQLRNAKVDIKEIDFKKLDLDNYYRGKKTFIGTTSAVIYEHEFPVKSVQDELTALYEKNALTVENVVTLIKDKCRICILARSEDDWLNAKGYKNERPGGRYPEEAGIEEHRIVYSGEIPKINH